MIVVYGGITIYGNIHLSNADDYYSPDKDKAQYSARIINSGLTFYSDRAVQNGSIIVLDGYWELIDDKYEYQNELLPLDEKIFGPIRLVKR